MLKSYAMKVAEMSKMHSTKVAEVSKKWPKWQVAEMVLYLNDYKASHRQREIVSWIVSNNSLQRADPSGPLKIGPKTHW